MDDLEKYILARFFYKIGKPFISDSEYNTLEVSLSKTCPEIMDRFLKVSFDQDEVPIALLRKWGYTIKSDWVNSGIEVSKKFLPTSVTPVYSNIDAIKFIRENPEDLIFSLKEDGISVRAYGEDGKNLAVSRSKEGREFLDYSYALNRMLPKVDLEGLILYLEAFVKEGDDLNYLELMYGNHYVNQLTAALAYLRVPINDEDYNKISYNVFKVEGLNLPTLSEELKTLSDWGFAVVPYIVIKKEIFSSRSDEEIKIFIDKLLSNFWEVSKSMGIGADGVIMEVNSRESYNKGFKEGSMKNEKSLALKYNEFYALMYSSTILDIEFSSLVTDSICPVAIIEPVMTSNNKTVSRVPIVNLKTMFEKNLNIGNPITFEYKGGMKPNLL